MKESIRWSTDPNVVHTIAQDSFGGWEHAINEAVKNSLDAHATWVKITLPSRDVLVGPNEQEVVIEDNGDGMGLDELRESYCRFGRYKPLHRGTGKVATFKVASKVALETWRQGVLRRIEFSTAELLSARDDEFPECEVALGEVSKFSKGTRIVLSGFNEAAAPPAVNVVHHVLLRNFYHRTGVEFVVNDEVFHAADHATEVLVVENQAIDGVGMAKMTVLLAKPNDRISRPGIVVFAGGQTVHGPDLFGLDLKGYRGDAERAIKRVIGRLDITPMDPEPIKSGVWTISEQFGLVREWVGQQLETVVDKETAAVVDERVDRWLQDPPTRRFYEKLPSDERATAKRILREQAKKTGSPPSSAQTIINRLVCRSLASDALEVVLEVLSDSSREEVESFSELFRGHDKWTLRQVTRAASLVKHHLQAVEDLDACKADYSRNEWRIHEILKENPWLIADDFHSFRSNRQLRTTLRNLFDIDIDDKEALKRPDFFFALGDVASSSLAQQGRYLFVELKGPDQPLRANHQHQVVDDAKTFLRHQPGFAFCVLIGTEVDPTKPPDPEAESKGTYSFRSMTYEQVIERARFRLEYMADGVRESGAEELARKIRRSEVERLVDTSPQQRNTRGRRGEAGDVDVIPSADTHGVAVGEGAVGAEPAPAEGIYSSRTERGVD